MKKSTSVFVLISVAITLVVASGVLIGLNHGSASPRDADMASPSSNSSGPRPELIKPDENLNERWQEIVKRFPIASRPASDELHRYHPGEFPYERAACLANANVGGFSSNGYGISGSTPIELDGALRSYLCAVRFPIVGEPVEIVPISSIEVSRLYESILEYSDCIAQYGEPVPNAISSAEFQARWPSVGPLPQPDLSIMSPSIWNAVSTACVQPKPRP